MRRNPSWFVRVIVNIRVIVKIRVRVPEPLLGLGYPSHY